MGQPIVSSRKDILDVNHHHHVPHDSRRRPSYFPFTYTRLASISHVILAVFLILPYLASAAYVPFYNCLSDSVKTPNSKHLQISPHFVDATIGAPPNDARFLNITVYGNVSGISVNPSSSDSLPAAGDPYWTNDNETAGKIVSQDGDYTTLSMHYYILGYEIHKATPEPLCDTLIQGHCPIAPVFSDNESDPSILPAFSFGYSLPSSYAFASILPHIRVISGDSSHTELFCLDAEIAPDLGTKLSNLLRFFPLAILILVGVANLAGATLSPWGTSDPFHFSSNFGRDEDLVRLVTPTFTDCLHYIQFVVLAGSLSLKYPSFYQPAVSRASWSVLMFNQSFVSDGAGRPAVTDGIYNVNPDDTLYGLDTVGQLVGLQGPKDIWAGFVIWLLVIIGGAILISQLFIGLRWISLAISGDRDHNMRALNFAFTLGNVLRVVLNFFLFPAVALSLFQLVKTSTSSTVTVAFAVILLVILLGGSGYILWLIGRTRPKSYLFDDLPTLLLFGPLYNTYADDVAPFFTVLTTIITFARGIAVGALQPSGIAQLVLLAISEIVLMIMLLAFRPYQSATHMNLYHWIAAFVRCLTILLSVAFIPALSVTAAVRGWIGYVILVLHGIILIFGFFMNGIQTLVEVGLRLCGAGGDSERRGGLVRVLGMRQLSRRRGKAHVPHHSINSAAEILGRASTQLDAADDSRHSRSFSAGSTLLLGRGNGPVPSGLNNPESDASHSRANSTSAARAMTPTAAMLRATPSSSDFTLSTGPTTPSSQRVMGLAALRAREHQGGPFYRPPRPGPVRTWTRRKGTSDGTTQPDPRMFPGGEGVGGASSASGYLVAAREDPDGDPYADDAVAMAAKGGRPAKDYAIREADFYYRVRGPALSAKPTRKMKTGPTDPMNAQNTGVTGWFKGLFGLGKTKEQGKGFEVVRSQRAVDLEEGDIEDENGQENIGMDTRQQRPAKAEEDAILPLPEDKGSSSKEEVVPDSYSLQSQDIFPEPYHDDPIIARRNGSVRRNWSRSETSSVRRPGRAPSITSGGMAGSILHEADEEGDRGLYGKETQASSSGPPMLPAVEHTDAIELPSRHNSEASARDRSMPGLPAEPTNAVYRPSVTQLTRQASQVSRAPTIPRRSSKRPPSQTLENLLNVTPPLPSEPGSGSESTTPLIQPPPSASQSAGHARTPSQTDLLTDDSQPRFPFMGGTTVNRNKSTSDRSGTTATYASTESSTAGPLKSLSDSAAAAARSAEDQASGSDQAGSSHDQQTPWNTVPYPLTTSFPSGPAAITRPSPATPSGSSSHYSLRRGPSVSTYGPVSAVTARTHQLPTPTQGGAPASPSATITSPIANNPYAYLPNVREASHGEVHSRKTSDGIVHEHSQGGARDLRGTTAEIMSSEDASVSGSSRQDMR